MKGDDAITEMGEHFSDLKDELAYMGDDEYLRSCDHFIHVGQRTKCKTNGFSTSILRLGDEVATRSRMQTTASTY